MRSFIKINKDENELRCVNCVYFGEEEGYCSKKKKKVDENKSCRKFELNIMVKSAKKRHSPNVKKYTAEDFDI